MSSSEDYPYLCLVTVSVHVGALTLLKVVTSLSGDYSYLCLVTVPVRAAAADPAEDCHVFV